MSQWMILPGLPSAISLRASGHGHTPCAAQDGRMTDRELSRMHGSLLHKAIELRGGHPQGNRRAQLMAAYRRPQASLMAILQEP